MENKLDKQTVDFLLVLAQQHDSFSYSGRDMFGKQCVAVTIAGSIAETVAYIIESYVEEFGINDLAYIVGFFSQAQTDSLGRGVVLYFPYIEYVDVDTLAELSENLPQEEDSGLNTWLESFDLPQDDEE